MRRMSEITHLSLFFAACFLLAFVPQFVDVHAGHVALNKL